MRVEERPERGSGCVVMILGLCLAPVLIGIVIFFYGLSMHGKVKTTWHCSGCGTVFPSVPQIYRPKTQPAELDNLPHYMKPKRPDNTWAWATLSVLALLAGLVFFILVLRWMG